MFADLPGELISKNTGLKLTGDVLKLKLSQRVIHTGLKLTGDVLKLKLSQRVIHTAQCHQLLMCTQFFHLAIF